MSKIILISQNIGYPKMNYHTSHISHCEIKSHRIWPIWKAIPIKKLKPHRIFRPFHIGFYEEININHTLYGFHKLLTWKKKYFRLHVYWGSSKVMFKKISQNFVKSPLKFSLISQILVHSLWHVWIMDIQKSRWCLILWKSSRVMVNVIKLRTPYSVPFYDNFAFYAVVS